MAKPNKGQAPRRVPRAVRAARAERRPDGGAMPRSMQRGTADRGKGGPPLSVPRGESDPPAVTRVTHETEVRGTETRVERVVERARKPMLTGGDRATGRGRYVYCIIRATAPFRFGAIGMDDQWPEVYTVNYRDMAAVVSDVPMVPLDSTRENVLAHERVNEIVMRDHTVIPMSFGTIFKTRDDILELLRSAYEAFNDVLNKMQDKLEFGLKVLWDRDEIVRIIEQEDEDIHRLKSEISSQKGSTYFARMQYGRLIDSALQQRSERYVAEFLQRLRDVSVASRINRAIGDKMIMNAAFLVQRDLEQQFDRRIKEIASQFDKLTFKYTGPWPPYNFVNIRLKLERAGQH
jgi:gas vesicle protein GvpL/GvpF